MSLLGVEVPLLKYAWLAVYAFNSVRKVEPSTIRGACFFSF